MLFIKVRLVWYVQKNAHQRFTFISGYYIIELFRGRREEGMQYQKFFRSRKIMGTKKIGSSKFCHAVICFVPIVTAGQNKRRNDALRYIG